MEIDNFEFKFEAYAEDQSGVIVSTEMGPSDCYAGYGWKSKFEDGDARFRCNILNIKSGITDLVDVGRFEDFSSFDSLCEWAQSYVENIKIGGIVFNSNDSDVADDESGASSL